MSPSNIEGITVKHLIIPNEDTKLECQSIGFVNTILFSGTGLSTYHSGGKELAEVEPEKPNSTSPARTNATVSSSY